eukprot:GHVR01061422.1.p1 GENE.GHVR01061422.1~~GHVR01061422.1.p1  ORF type:complete len:172 (+),score=45.46 GHVR01061422.1:242-757(+)
MQVEVPLTCTPDVATAVDKPDVATAVDKPDVATAVDKPVVATAVDKPVDNVHTPSRAYQEQFFRIKMCPWLDKGRCWRGDHCTYAHSPHQLVQSPVSLQKTRLCQLYLKGECSFSSEVCKYAHGNVELRATTDYFKTAICRFWSVGSCPQGMSCRHAHGTHDLRPKPLLMS